jgi:hypothetical protein
VFAKVQAVFGQQIGHPLLEVASNWVARSASVRAACSRQELVPLGGGPLIGRPVTHSLRVTAKLAIGVSECHEHGSRPDVAPVRSNMASVLLGPSQCPRWVEVSLNRSLVPRGKETVERHAQKLRLVVAEHALHARVPAHGAALTIEQEHGIVLHVLDE